jgi:hypothetical protein
MDVVTVQWEWLRWKKLDSIYFSKFDEALARAEAASVGYYVKR